MLPVKTAPKAKRDTAVFFDYIAQDNLESAIKYLERVEETYHIISQFPLIATAFSTHNPKLLRVRWIPVKDFPKHLIFYTVNDTEILVIRIFHKSQEIEKILN